MEMCLLANGLTMSYHVISHASFIKMVMFSKDPIKQEFESALEHTHLPLEKLSKLNGLEIFMQLEKYFMKMGKNTKDKYISLKNMGLESIIITMGMNLEATGGTMQNKEKVNFGVSRE